MSNVDETKIKSRPARPQVASRPVGPAAYSKATEVNLWSGKPLGKRKLPADRGPAMRCDPDTDSGFTRAPESAYLCLHFARGECSLGAECSYLHRLPVVQDEQRPITYDVFGRDKFRYGSSTSPV